MKFPLLGRLTVVGAALLLSFSANAALYSRDFDGNLSNGYEGAYDDILDVTWVTNINLYAEQVASGYIPADPSSDWVATSGEYIFSYWNFSQWVDQLDYAGSTDWRLPIIAPVNGSFFQTGYSNDANNTSHGMLTDTGVGIVSEQSELAHLINFTLGNSDGPFIGLTAENTFYYAHIENCGSTDFMVSGGGRQTRTGGSCTRDDWGFAKGVLLLTDGDFSAAVVPIPAAAWLFGSALAGLLVGRRKQR